ncbi:hypothetical protein CWI36_3060p0010 [Hamiltosporidium magnivora]|uniref:Uncharacterized protein n=1 Tax=Hamiltosporidium magnivora TaxID=148818 RepID=A0A4Q9KRT3_9MICR|nr:hypothetical protein CWI36_3060p0010 [Hamiltosporidium magnivora]
MRTKRAECGIGHLKPLLWVCLGINKGFFRNFKCIVELVLKYLCEGVLMKNFEEMKVVRIARINVFLTKLRNNRKWVLWSILFSSLLHGVKILVQLILICTFMFFSKKK